MLNVLDFGAIGNGAADDTAALSSALAAVSGEGGEVRFPGRCYRITSSLRPKSGTRLVGEHAKIVCDAAGWPLIPVTGFGLLNIDNKESVSLSGLSLWGTKAAAHNNTPKLIYLHNSSKVSIFENELANTAFEGIWQGGDAGFTKNVLIRGNFLKDIGHPAGPYVGLPAIQLSGIDAIISDNLLENVGTGIGASGTRITVANNRITGVKVVGIGTGDGAPSYGIVISGNAIELASCAVTRTGIKLDSAVGGDSRLCLVNGNHVRLIGSLTGAPARCIWSTSARYVAIENNALEIENKGVGIELAGTDSGVLAFLKSNVVLVQNEASRCFGISGVPNGSGKTLKVVSDNNRVFGMSLANSSFSYDFNANGGGTLSARMINDWTDEGNVRLGTTFHGSGQDDNLPINLSN